MERWLCKFSPYIIFAGIITTPTTQPSFRDITSSFGLDFPHGSTHLTRGQCSAWMSRFVSTSFPPFVPLTLPLINLLTRFTSWHIFWFVCAKWCYLTTVIPPIPLSTKCYGKTPFLTPSTSLTKKQKEEDWKRTISLLKNSLEKFALQDTTTKLTKSVSKVDDERID